MNRLNKGGDQRTYNRYRYMIKSVDGKEDTKSIVDFVNNKFLRDTRAFRNIWRNFRMNMEFEWNNPQSGVKRKNLSLWELGFFGLSNYSSLLHNQIFEMCYFGNGYTFKDVYEMFHIRNFHYKKLADIKKQEKEQQDKAWRKHHQMSENQT